MSNVEPHRQVPSSELAMREYVKVVANSEVLPERWRGKIRDIYTAIKAGEEIGLPPMVSLRWLYLVQGRVGLAAEAMNAIARERGHSISGSTTDEKAIAKGKRADTGDEMEVQFTMAMAERARLTKGVNWERYPDDMLWARAVSKLCRRLFPDVFGGMAYSREELESIDEADFVPISEPVTSLKQKQADPSATWKDIPGDREPEIEEQLEADPHVEPVEVIPVPEGSDFQQMAEEAVKRGRKKTEGTDGD